MQEMLDKNSVTSVNQQSPKKKETALHYACRGKSMDSIKFLVERGADVNIKGNNVLLNAVVSSFICLVFVAFKLTYSLLCLKLWFCVWVI